MKWNIFSQGNENRGVLLFRSNTTGFYLDFVGSQGFEGKLSQYLMYYIMKTMIYNFPKNQVINSILISN